MFSDRSKSLKQRLSGRSALWTIILLGILLRIGSALFQGNSIRPLPGVTDQISYHQLALRVLDGKGFSFKTGWWPVTAPNKPTAHWSYLYVLFLSATYALFGSAPLVARLIQAVAVGLLQPLLTWRIGNRLFGPRVGLVSAAISSFYIYFVFYAGSLVTESFYIVAILWALDISLTLAASAKQERGLWAQLGLALAVASILRQVILLLVPVLLAWIVWQVARRGSSGNEVESGTPGLWPLSKGIALALAILFACILPWTIRNYRAFGQFVLLNTNAGYAFFVGNHPMHGTEFIPILPGPGSRYAMVLPEGLPKMNEAELEKDLLRRGLAFVREDPKRYMLLSLSRFKEYFKFWPSPDSSRLSNYARVLSFGLVLPFLLAGVLLTLSSRRIQARVLDCSGTMLLLGIAGLYSLMHLLTWTLVRYRLPVDAITLPFAAFSIVYVYERLSGSFRLAAVPLVKSAE